MDDTTFTVASGGDDGLCKVTQKYYLATLDFSGYSRFTLSLSIIPQVWDRRALREDNPKPVGVLAGTDI